MHIAFSSNFNKKIKKIPSKTVDKFFERLELFKENKFHPILNNHKLHGEYDGCSSINITGNFRAVFEYISEEYVIFSDIDTHPGLYE
jgi:mRNA-degrading endonuclease YafQ of YafQ-DinJ toxin-antitoxin module